MPISPNSIIHFTKSKESLKGILSDNFKLKYCREIMPFSDEQVVVYVPMVSFCDIPLSQVKEHIEKYGEYGLGLTREWAVKNKLNPVLYVEPSSHLSESYLAVINQFFPGAVEQSDEESQGLRNIADFLRYMKPYQGPLIREGREHGSYRFSDEREWRFVPSHQAECEMLYTEHDGEGYRKKAALSLDALRLHFEPNDIKYIIIKDDSEISEFISHLRGVKGGKYLFNDVDRLSARILTAEQIRSDF
ncbi:MAG: hypothetical protein KF800_05660 [Lysobacter sp.]|nr:hypothetical protein [Lysobacter sp.]